MCFEDINVPRVQLYWGAANLQLGDFHIGRQGGNMCRMVASILIGVCDGIFDIGGVQILRISLVTVDFEVALRIRF